MDLSGRSLIAYSRNPPEIAFEAAKDSLRPEVYAALKRAQEVLPFAIRVTSAGRPGGRSTSQHFTGNAADIGMRDLNEAQRVMLVKALINEGGFNRIGAYSGNTGLHVDMKPQRAEGGAPWPMFDKTRANMHMAPQWFLQGLQGFRGGVPMTVPVVPVASVKTPSVTPRAAAVAAPSPPGTAATGGAGLAPFLASPQGAASGFGAGMGLAAILGGGGGATPRPMAAPEVPDARVVDFVAPVAEMPRPMEFAAIPSIPLPAFDPIPVPDIPVQNLIGRQGYRRGVT